MDFPKLMELVCRYAVCAVFMALAFASPTLAEKGKLRERLTPAVMAVVFPGAERLGVEEGSPPAIAVYQSGKIVAYVFSTLDIVAAIGYSGTPFDVIAGVDLGVARRLSADAGNPDAVRWDSRDVSILRV